jgi:hypothetical protein
VPRGDGFGGRRCRGRHGRHRRQLHAATTAVHFARFVRRAARSTGRGQRGIALGAEASLNAVIVVAARAAHRASSLARGTQPGITAIQAARFLTFLSSALRFLPSFQRSYCVCWFIQLSGVVSNAIARRMAISGLMRA